MSKQCIRVKNNSEILSGNTIAAVWQNSNIEVINEDLLPLFFKRISNSDKLLEIRTIGSHRTNARLLKKTLRLAEKDDISTVVHVNAVQRLKTTTGLDQSALN